MKTKIELTENATMLVDANIQLPNAVKNVLGALIFASGAYTEHRKENSDWFYKDADSLIEESQVSKKTFFRAINLLETNNFIERKSGSLKKGENKVTQYKVLKGVNILSNDTLKECQKPSNDTLENTNDTLNDTLGEPLMTHKNKELSNKNKETSIKKKELSNKNKEKEIDNKNNNKEKLKEKENLKKIDSRLDELQLEIKELKASNNELQLEVKELKAKLNQDASTSSNSSSTNETSMKQEKSDSKPSNGSSLPTTHQEEEKPTEAQQIPSKLIVASTGTSKVEDYTKDENVEGSIEDSESNQEKSSTTDEKASSGTTIPQKDEKLTEGKETASMAIAEDVDVDYEYGLFISAVEACEENNIQYDGFKLLNFKNMILQDLSEKNASYRVRKEVELKIDNFIQDFNEKSNSKPSNEPSGIVTNQNDEKPTESVSKASTAISEDNDATSNDVDDLFDGIIISGKASKKNELKRSNKGTDCTPVKSEDTKKDDSKENSKEAKDLKMPKTVEGCFQRYLESVEEQKKLGLNNTRKDLLYQKDCIIQSCKIEGFEESFIQELEAKIDEHIKEYSEKCDSKPSNDTSLTTTHQDDSKPTEGKEMPLNEKKLRYLDTSTDKQYATEAEAQKDGVNPWFLYDWKVGRCIAEYTSPTSPSNEGSGIVANQNDLKPAESQQMPSTSMSYSYAVAY